MAVEPDDLNADLNLAQRFQQLYVRKSLSKLGGQSMKGFKEFLLRGNVIDMAVESWSAPPSARSYRRL